MKKKFSQLLVILFSSITSLPVLSAADGAPFTVTGEQVVHRPPAGWKLAWMSGKSDGNYFSEYIPDEEDINSWRKGYLLIQRIGFPPNEIVKALEKNRIRIGDALLYSFMQEVRKTCGGRQESMEFKGNNFNGLYFAMGGGFCDRYGPAAPFGEGQIVGFVEGKNFMFRIQYSWRPRSTAEHGDHIPWRIAQDKIEQYRTAIQATTICGNAETPACKD